MSKLTTWSYSRYSTYKQCPLKAKLLYIDKLQEPSSPALDNGAMIHGLCEEYLNNEDMPLDERFIKWKLSFERLREAGAIAEQMWSLDQDWKPCGPFDKDVWLRGKIDAHFCYDNATKLVVVDFKTGKVRPLNLEQLELYALMGFAWYPSVLFVDTELWYLDQGEVQQMKFSAAQVENLKQKWEARIKGYFTDERFEPTPSALCGWCAFSKAKNGPCQY